MAQGSARREFLARTGVVVAGSTLALTASFVGLLGLGAGAVSGASARFPVYLIVAGMVFVATMILLEEHALDARVTLLTSVVTGLTSLVAIGLSVEGILYAVRHPEEVFVSNLVLYFIAAALIATGLGYWAVKHWRELTRDDTGDGL